MRWADVGWANSHFRVTSTKTESEKPLKKQGGSQRFTTVHNISQSGYRPCRARTCDPLIKSQRNESTTTETPTAYDDTKTDLRSNPRTWDENDPDLAAVVAAWTTLPKTVRVGILAMVRAAAGDESTE